MDSRIQKVGNADGPNHYVMRENWVDGTSHPSSRDPPFQLLDRMPVDRSSESADSDSDSVYQYIDMSI